MSFPKKVFFPGWYFLHTRIQSKKEFVSWFALYPGFIFFVVFLSSSFSVLSVILTFLLSFVAWQSLYDFGYIFNDVVVTGRENHPNYRLPKDEISAFLPNLKLIFLVKLVFSVLAFILLYCFCLFFNLDLNLFLFGVLCVLGGLFFYIHNLVRSRLNIITYFFLSSIKYLSIPSLVFSSEVSFINGVFVLLVFPFIRSIEHASKPKYGLSISYFVRGDLDFFRFSYYSCVLFLSIIFIFFGFESSWFLFFLASYFWVFRLSGLVVGRS